MDIGENLTIYLYIEKQIEYRDRDRDMNMDVDTGILHFRDLSVLSWPGIKVPKLPVHWPTLWSAVLDHSHCALWSEE